MAGWMLKLYSADFVGLIVSITTFIPIIFSKAHHISKHITFPHQIKIVIAIERDPHEWKISR